MKALPVILAGILALSCTGTEPVNPQKHKVVLLVTDAAGDIAFSDASKTVIGSDGHSVYWSDDDRIALWAESTAGLELEAEPFRIYGLSGNRAFFTAEIGAPLSAQKYSYYAASPLPAATAWPYASFEIPALQDGTGQGIMIAPPVEGPGLKSIDETPEGETVALRMEQQLHLLKFSISDPENLLDGEQVQRLALNFPKAVSGTFVKDLSDYDSEPELEDGGYGITIEPSGKTLYATIFPRDWSTLNSIGGRIYTETKVATLQDLPLQGRNMVAGHATNVTLRPASLVNRCKVYVRLRSNPLGEDLNSITLTAPSGCRWGDNLGNSYTWYKEAGITPGEILTLEYEDESAFRTLSGKGIGVTFDSEHVQTAQTVNIPNLSGKYSTTLELDVPPLLDENFSSVGSFSSNDEYKTSSAGSKDAYSFLGGWTGGRVGASAGKCIRIACRRETSADYPARVESAPLTGTIKKSCNLKVEFSYGSNNRFGGIPIILDGNVGQNCYIGYVTSTKGYKSGDTDGVYDRTNNTFYAKEYTGSWDNTPNDTDYTLSNVPAGSLIRISWRTEIEHQAGTTNTTCWLYLDNIKVTIEP